MGLFRIRRAIVVDARQCTNAETIATDLGFVNVKRGNWIIRGEDGETYILSDAFFQRTFSSIQKQQPHAGPVTPAVEPVASVNSPSNQFPHNREHRSARQRARAVHSRTLRMH